MNGSENRYMEVHEEPLHKEEFVNRILRIYRAVLEPGKQTEYHRHSQNTLYIVIKGGRITTRNLKRSPNCPTVLSEELSAFQRLSLAFEKIFRRSVFLEDGFVFYMPSRQYPVIHKAQASRDNSEKMNLLGIEIREVPVAGNEKHTHDAVIIQRDETAVSRFAIDPGKKLLLPPTKVGRLTVIVKGEIKSISENGGASFAAGEYYWSEEQASQTLVNPQDRQAEIIIVEKKAPAA